MTIHNQNGRYAVIDYAKGFSITTIVVMHVILMFMFRLPTIVQKASMWGGSGVHIFIFMSGLGLMLSRLNAPCSTAVYIKKRFLSIYIPYIVVIIISFFIPFVVFEGDRISALFSHVFLYKMFNEDYNQSFGPQFWFISTIIQFYIIFLPLCSIKKHLKKNSIFFIFALTLSIIWWCFTFANKLNGTRIWSSFFLQYLWEFALGMCVADMLTEKKEFHIKNAVLLITAVLFTALYAIMATTNGAYRILNDIPAFFGYLSILLLLYNIPIIKKLFIMISGFSYELFLTHYAVLITGYRLVKPKTVSQQLMYGIPAFFLCFIVAWLISVLRKKLITRT